MVKSDDILQQELVISTFGLKKYESFETILSYKLTSLSQLVAVCRRKQIYWNLLEVVWKPDKKKWEKSAFLKRGYNL